MHLSGVADPFEVTEADNSGLTISDWGCHNSGNESSTIGQTDSRVNDPKSPKLKLLQCGGGQALHVRSDASGHMTELADLNAEGFDPRWSTADIAALIWDQ